MDQYFFPIQVAFLVFPLLAALFTVPYILYQYHKYGSVPVLRTLIVYSFILYLTSIYFLVILPLPSIESVAKLTTPETQLVPFQFVLDFIHHVSFQISDPSTYLNVIKAPEFYQVVYNIIMTVPFGIYLRYYFKCGWLKTILLTFGLSLFFEFTQLTGLYGIYPRSYRLFDVDDLMLNTLGGMVGFLITPIFWKFLPSRDKLDQIAYKKSEKISFLRRFTAYCIDWFFMSILISLVGILIGRYNSDVVNITYVVSVLIYFVFLPTCYQGKTIGKRFVNIKIVTLDGKTPKWYQYLIRYGCFYLFFFSIPAILVSLMKLLVTSSMVVTISVSTIMLLLTILYFYFLFGIFRVMFQGEYLLLYERFSQTKNQSTIVLKEEEETN